MAFIGARRRRSKPAPKGRSLAKRALNKLSSAKI